MVNFVTFQVSNYYKFVHPIKKEYIFLMIIDINIFCNILFIMIFVVFYDNFCRFLNLILVKHVVPLSFFLNF